MFLNLLNEREAKDFLELASIATKADGKVDEAEKALLNTYRTELQLFDYEIKNKELKDLVTAFLASTKKVKKAIIIELAGVLDSDDEISLVENEWIKNLGHDLGFRDTEMNKMLRWTQDFNDLILEAWNYINNR